MMASFVMTSPSTSPPFATSTWRPARTVPTTVPSIFTTPSATMSPSTRMPAPMIESPASDSGAPCPFSVKIAMSILLFHDSERVERPSVTADFEVQVRSRGSPRGSGQRDHLPCLHRVSLAYQQPRGMPVHRLIPLGMAQEHEQAITEPDAGSDVAGITTVARRDGDHYVVNGRKIFITSGARCHWALVVTKTDRERGHKGYNLLVIEKDTPGFQVTRTLKKLGMHSSDTAELLFEDCRVPVANLIGDEGEGFKNLMWELQGERMIAAAGAIAGATRVFEYTMEYARNRKAFGQPISNFQVIKHKLVDMGTKIASVQAFVYQTAKLWDQGEYPVRDISQAKLLATQVACEVADDAIQILGGHGYMREFPVERAWRDARLARIGAGTDESMKEIIAKAYGL